MYIYCYTNKVNGKKYIGQSNNPERRKREHKSRALNIKANDYNMPFYSAIRKYGWENFDFEILLESLTPNEDEIRLIEEYNTTKTGYNIQLGGQENSFYMRKLTEEEAKEVRTLIKEGRGNQVKEKFGISDTLISNINHGLKYFSKDETYPLKRYYKENKDYQELIDLLRETNLSFAKIAKQLNIGLSTVKKINYGKLNSGLCSEYPIRPYTRKPVSTIPKA